MRRKLLALSPREVVASRIVEIGALVKATDKMLRRILGEDVLIQIRPRIRA